MTTTAIDFARTYHQPKSDHTHEVFLDMPGLLVTKARQVVDGTTDQPVAHFLNEDDMIAVPYQSARHGTLYKTYRAATVWGYALKYRECPVAAIERAKAQGEELHYLVALPATVSGMKRERPTAYRVQPGELVKFHGRFFRLTTTGNGNHRLVEVK